MTGPPPARENVMGIVELIALSMGLAWASGINLYAALAMLGIMGATGHMVLPPGLEVLAHPAVIGAAGFMYCVEFFADKVPGVDTGWDVAHSFIRIPAGAVLAAMALGDVSPEAQIAAAILGGGLAATSHVLKASTRIVINTSPEPVSNWTASILEDVAVLGGLWVALNHPIAFLALLAAFVIFCAWAIPKLWRFTRRLIARIGRLFGGAAPEPVAATAGEPARAASGRITIAPGQAGEIEGPKGTG
jgi:hypothetical protein